MSAQLPRAFRWFWAGETVSGFGSWITILTLQVIGGALLAVVAEPIAGR
ncbi:hypothetical protein [Brevibacterium sandarakinum]|nr:hypothetical protein [Brevibacterium sandarakinum]MDN5634490.1 hypothetical protein [Brevibacterium sp.]MDN5657063.1 hypothetical protein [Brevibacterium sandarakinum]